MFVVFGLYIISAPLAYIPDIQHIFSAIPFTFLLHLVVLFFLGLFFVFYSRLILPQEVKVVLWVFLLPALLSSVALCFHVLGDFPFYTDLTIVLTEYVTRIINLFINLSIFVFLVGYAYCMPIKFGERILRFYYALLFISVIGGLWQFFSFSWGIPFPELAVKSNFHGVGEEAKFQFGSRLTSFFAEPSYFVAFVIDFLILSFFLIKKWKFLGPVIGIGIFVLIASYSISGMANILLLMFVATAISLFASNLRRKKDVIRAFLLIGVLTTMTVIAVTVGADVLLPYYERFGDRIFVGNDHRFDTIGRAFSTWLANGPTVHLFGFGPGMFALFKYQTEPMEGTSNNLYLDFLLENGVVGVVAVILFFAYFLKKGLNRLQIERYSFVAVMLVVHLAISSLYRADFISPRFWVIIFIVIHLFKNQKVMPEMLSTNEGFMGNPLVGKDKK